MTEPDHFLKLKSIKSEIRCLLTSAAKYGLTTNSLIKDYQDICSEYFPYHDFGFTSPDDFLKSKHFEEICYLKNGKWHAKINEKTEHIRKLVKGQKSNGLTSMKGNKGQYNFNSNQIFHTIRNTCKKKINNHHEFAKEDEIFKSIKEKENANKQILSSISNLAISSAPNKPCKHSFIPKRISYLEQQQIQTIIYQILKSEKGLVTQNTLQKRFKSHFDDSRYFKNYSTFEASKKFTSPKNLFKTYGKNVLQEIRFVLGQGGNVRAEILNSEDFDTNLEERDVIRRWTLKNATMRPLPSYTIGDLSPTDQLKIENKIINILKSEAKCHWITNTTIRQRFKAAIGDPNYFSKFGINRNHVPSQKKFFEYYGKDIIKEVKFFEDE